MSKNDPKNKNNQSTLLILLSFATGLFLFILIWQNASPAEVLRGILWILAFVAVFGSLILGLVLIIRSYSAGDQETQSVADEIEAMANDASFDISEQIIIWDKLKYTKGVGTQLEGRDEEISDIHRRLVNVREEIAAAETPQHRLEAVLSADSMLATARSLH